MRFALDDQQVQFRDAVRDVLAEQCPPRHVRDWWDAMETSSATPSFVGFGPWAALAEMGVLGACIHPDAGGMGLSFMDVVAVCEEVGRVALPEPFIETAVVAGPLLSELASSADGAVAARLSEVAGAVAAGERPIGVAIGADIDGRSGTARLVPFADVGMVVVAHGDEVHLVEIDAEHEALVAQRSVDGARRVFALDVSRLALADSTCVGAGPGATAAVDDARRRAEVATAALLVGLGRQMLDMTVGYVSERRQFGAPVGSFQAVKHHLADAALRLEFAVPLVHQAAAVLSGVPGADDEGWGPIGVPEVAASTAKAQASEAAAGVAAAALQCHGAIGYTVEYDLHLYLKRTWALSRAWGDAAHHRRTVAAHLLR